MQKLENLSIRQKVVSTMVVLFLGMLGLLVVGCQDNNSSSSVNDSEETSQIQTATKTNENKSTSVKEDKSETLTEWKGHDLGEYKFVLNNDKYCFIVRDIDKVEDSIRFTYTFINESGDDMSSIWNFQCIPYQNGINLKDNKEYRSSYYKCGNEQTSIRSGYSIDDCWCMIPVGDGSEIECDMGAGLWNETHLLKLNPETLEWSIESK